jgi:hypothetical protein
LRSGESMGLARNGNADLPRLVTKTVDETNSSRNAPDQVIPIGGCPHWASLPRESKFEGAGTIATTELALA